MSLKIAICLFGKFTGVNIRNEIQDFSLLFKSLYEHVIDDNTDIFLHGWDDNPIQTKILLDTIKPKKYLLEKQIIFNHPYKHYNFINSGPWNTQDHIFNNYSRFYSLKKSIELVDDDYDFILLCRFDTVFYEKINFECMEPKNLYVSHWCHHYDHHGVNDCWFISSPKNIKNLSLIYDRLDMYFSDNSMYLEFIKQRNFSEKNYPSGHLIFRYRIFEMGLCDFLYGYGLEHITYGLARNYNNRSNEMHMLLPDIRKPKKLSHIPKNIYPSYANNPNK
jgi:hypothetical protein